MSVAPLEPRLDELPETLAAIAEGAAARDQAAGCFPEDSFRALERCGATGWNARAGTRRPSARDELGLVRAVAGADGSLGRIFDGHLNAIERLVAQGPAELVREELPRFAAGTLRAGVWGGDPVPGEGPPAAVVSGPGGRAVLRGVKTFCSGAGGLHRALVLARGPEAGPPVCVWIDLTDERRVEVDESWYRSHGLRASVSHRVVFHDAPVIGQFGGPGSIGAAPWFSRDALRTAASWAGMADTAVAGALDELARRPGRSALEGLAAGRIGTAHAAIDLWLTAAAEAMGGAPPEAMGGAATNGLRDTALRARVAIADACRLILDEAARACGSRPFAHGSSLDRARRDLELFLLQHRLDPMLARAGEALLAARAAALTPPVGGAA